MCIRDSPYVHLAAGARHFIHDVRLFLDGEILKIITLTRLFITIISILLMHGLNSILVLNIMHERAPPTWVCRTCSTGPAVSGNRKTPLRFPPSYLHAVNVCKVTVTTYIDS